MQYTIQNDEVILTLDTHAAEIHSFKRKDDDYEYMWNGDKTYWAGRNPLLFPQVSSTPDKVNTIYGKQYPMGNHGFARNSEFECLHQTKDSITLYLKENEETLKQYPFEFLLFVTYELKGNSVNIKYDVVNKSKEVMPFGLGQHPAFNCPLGFKDTVITLDDQDKLEINDELFKTTPTKIYNPNTYKKAVLSANDHKLEVDFESYKILAIWSPFAPFVCIEPWVTCNPNKDLSFEDRENTIKLNPNENWSIDYSIKLLGKK